MLLVIYNDRLSHKAGIVLHFSSAKNIEQKRSEAKTGRSPDSRCAVLLHADSQSKIRAAFESDRLPFLNFQDQGPALAGDRARIAGLRPDGC